MERRPLIAMAISMMMPGLGQVYNGEMTKGVFLFSIFAFVVPFFSYVAAEGPSSWLVVFALLGVISALAVYIYCIRDAYVSARRIGGEYRLQAFNRPHVYLALLFVGYFVVLGQLSDYVTRDLIQAYRVPSNSMVPSILPGDHLLADKRINYPGGQKVQRGDAVIFVYPNDRTTIYIKRVIGLPGDRVEIQGDEVLINGRSIRGDEVHDLGSDELNQMLPDRVAYMEHGDRGDYIVLWKGARQPTSLSLSVPNGHVFLLGDNRDESYDSRDFGPVGLTDLIGTAKQVWFSMSQRGFRLGRVGMRLDVNG